MKISFLLLFISFVSFGCQTLPKCGPEVRAAFDIGSGSTKMKVAELNTCTETLTQVLHEEQVKVDYRDALEKSGDQNFPEKIQTDGLAALTQLKKVAESKGAQKFSGVATAAFRQAKNGAEFSKMITDKTGIPVVVISQDQEAILGFQSANLKYNNKDQSLIVWDIGGGSQQITMLDSKKEPLIYYGKMASVSFKNRVIKEVQKKDINKVFSPNPMSKDQVEKSKTLAINEAKTSVPSIINQALKDNKNISVVGIGGVLTKSLPRQVGKEASKKVQISQAELEKVLEKRRKLNDKQLKDPFADTDVTNLVLVISYMKALGITQYEPIDVSLMDGLWFDRQYFRP